MAPADRYADVPVRPAATVMLVRDRPGSGVPDSGVPDSGVPDSGVPDSGVEVFVLRRTAGAVFAAGFYVFPGGKVDAADGGPAIDALSDGIDDSTASVLLGVERGGLAYWVAAIRECFEESGVLLARRRDGGPLAIRHSDRTLVHDGTLSIEELCRRDGLVLDTGALRYVSHWVTPVGEPRRFDTRFFVAAAPPDQEGSHDDGETVASRWVRPADALAEAAAGQLMLLPPTVANLRFLAEAASVDDVLARADAAGPPPRIEPTLEFFGAALVGVTLPDGSSIALPDGFG